MMGTQHKVVGIGMGVAGAIIIVNGQGDQLGSLVAFTSAIGAMLPDIDHDRTKIGRKRKFVTKLSGQALTILVCVAICILGVVGGGMTLGIMQAGLATENLMVGSCIVLGLGVARKFLSNSPSFKWMTKHRGLMHTLVPVIALYFLMNATTYRIWYYGIFGILIGYCSHLFADMLTVEGCPILFPLSKRNIRILKLRTSHWTCWLGALGAAIVPILIALQITQQR